MRNMKLLSKRLVVIVCSVFILSIILCIHLRKGNFNLNNISSVQNANDISTTNSILNDDLVFSERYGIKVVPTARLFTQD